MRSAIIRVCALAAVVQAVGHGGEAAFSGKPVVEKAGDAITIRFAVAAATDVEVAVLDATNRVVCHLAAGVLGGANPPPAPLKPGLSQALTWDGRDDFGKPASGGPFAVRVRAGMKPLFSGFIGASPYALCTVRYAPVRGMALDKEGNLYVREEAYNGGGSTDIRVFDRSGKYLRTVMPYPASMKKDEAAPFGLVPAPGDFLVPRNQASTWAYLYESKPRGYSRSYGPLCLKLSAVTPDGVLLFLDESCRVLARIRASDGGSVGGVFGESIWPQGDKRFPDYCAIGGSPSMALAPDGKTLYFTGRARGPDKGQKLNPDFPDGRVYKTTLDRIGQGLETFADIALPEKGPRIEGGWAPGMGMASLQAVTVDGKGNVYVCDAANHCVHRFDPSGKETGTLPFPGAQMAVADDKSGAIYVISRGDKLKLAKFTTFDAGAQPVASLGLQGPGENQQSFLVVDAGAAKPQLWLGNANGRRPGAGLLRLEDNGTELKVVEDLSERDPFALRGVDRITVDPDTDDVYVSNGWNEIWRYNGITGKYNGALKDGKVDPIITTDVAVSPDGHVYIQKGPRYSGPYQRLDRNLQPAPLNVGTNGDSFGWVFGRYGQGYCTKGTAIGWDGRLHSFGMLAWCQYYVVTYGPDGRIINGSRWSEDVTKWWAGTADGDQVPQKSLGLTGALIGPVSSCSGGLKVDRQGYLYLGLNLFPEGYKPPAGFENEAAMGMAGSVVKFKPDGGGVPKGKRQDRLADHEGVVQAYPGYASFSGGWGGGCACRSPRFDLDPYGRLYLPNTVTFRVTVLDNAGNEICQFGHYGNFDSQWAPEDARGRPPSVATPDIPLGWPLSAGASEKKIYVGDLYNRRVVRVDKTYAAEAICPVK
jgi:sugar lactone lactonase YvrE